MLFQIPDATIAYDDEGQGNAILFIHGHPFNRSMWRPQLELLKKTHRVIAPDLRGYGESVALPIPLEATTLDVFAADLHVLLNHLSIPKVVLVGLSMGGQIAMEFAYANRNMVAGLVLAATFAEPETAEGVVLRNDLADRILDRGMAVEAIGLLPTFLSETSLKTLPGVAADVFSMMALTSPEDAASAHRGRAMRRDYRPVLHALQVPALIVNGTEDGHTTIDDAEAMQKLMTNAGLLVLNECGHLPNLERPEQFNDALKSLLVVAMY